MSMLINSYVFASGTPPPGGFPNPLGATSSATTTLQTSHIVNLPATVNNGDRLLLRFSNVLATVTPPGTFTPLAAGIHGGVFQGQWYYRDCDGSEGGTTVTFTLGTARRSVAIVERIQAGTFDPAQAPAISSPLVTGSSANPDPPTLSPPWGSANTLWFADYCGRNSGAVSVYPYPDGNVSINSGGSGTAHVEAASCWTKTASASLDPGTFTRINDAWVAATVAIKPV